MRDAEQWIDDYVGEFDAEAVRAIQRDALVAAADLAKQECRRLYRRKALIEGGVAAGLEHQIRTLMPEENQ